VNADPEVYRARSRGRIFWRMKTTSDDKRLATTWTMDPIHTTIGFSVRHLMVTNVRGVFQTASARVSYDPEAPEAIAIDAEIPAASVQTRDPQRDAHLRSGHFFDAEAHPTIRFRSTRARAAGPWALEIVGDLTMRGITREVTLAVEVIPRAQRDHNGAIRRGAIATAKIKRSEFGMTYNMVLEAGGIAIADEVSLTLDVSLVKDGAA
jgi:polyisoprenoid-binding protein YceI